MNAQYYTEIQLGTPAQTVSQHLSGGYRYITDKSLQFKVILDTG